MSVSLLSYSNDSTGDNKLKYHFDNTCSSERLVAFKICGASTKLRLMVLIEIITDENKCLLMIYVYSEINFRSVSFFF